MYSYEDRIRAVKLYIKLGKRLRATIRQLGYPRDWNSTTIEVFINAVHDYILWYKENGSKSRWAPAAPLRTAKVWD